MGLALSALGLPADAVECSQAGTPSSSSVDFLLNTILLTPFEILTCLFPSIPSLQLQNFHHSIPSASRENGFLRWGPLCCDNWAFTAFLFPRGRDHLYHVNQPVSVFSWAEVWCWESFPDSLHWAQTRVFLSFFPPRVMCWSPAVGKLDFCKFSL